MSLSNQVNGNAQDSVSIVGNLFVASEPGQASISKISLDSGAITTDGNGNITAGNLNFPTLFGKQSATAPVIVSGGGAGGTIATSGITVSRLAPGGAVTGAIMQAGLAAGQLCVVVNESAAANTITFATAVTSNVAGGTTVSLAGLASHLFVWDSVTSLWYQVGPATN